MEQWTRSDFYSHGGELDDEATFRARVHENAEHQRQRAALGRREIRAGANTPWGSSQGATIYANGVVCHSTAGHGGFHLDAAHNAKIHPALRARDGWYEEDCAWAAVAQAFPGHRIVYRRCFACGRRHAGRVRFRRLIREDSPMTAHSDQGMLLARMEAARNDIRHRLSVIERQIAARAERLTVTDRIKWRQHGRSLSSWTTIDERLFQQHVAELSLARRAEIDALMRKLDRQDNAIAAFRSRHSITAA
jgi:hypothetical protein